MVQIFISYSRADRAVAAQLADRLTENGYDVWWDAELVGGSRFDDEIKRVLREASAAVILWSENSARSDWVRAEADMARGQGTAIPVLIDEVRRDELPIPFQQLHMTRLAGWDGSVGAEGYQTLMRAVARLVGAVSGAGREAARPAAGAAAAAEPAEEMVVWADLEGSREATAEDYRAFLRRYPNARMAALAETRIRRLARRERRWLSWVLGVAGVAIVVAGGLFLLRLSGVTGTPVTPVTPVAECPAERVVRSQILPVSLCVDTRVWLPTGEGATTKNFQTTDKLYSFQIKAGTAYRAPDDYVQQVLAFNDGLANTRGSTELLRNGTRELAGRTWTVFQFKRPYQSDSNAEGTLTIEYDQTYYYGDPAFGAFELTIWTNQEADTLSGLGDPLVRTVVFD
jgi:hypothetical protein